MSDPKIKLDEEAADMTTLNTRVPKRIKSAIQRAAELRGQSLSEFVLGSAYDRALATISAEHIMELSDRDSAAFAAALASPVAVDQRILERFLDAASPKLSR